MRTHSSYCKKSALALSTRQKTAITRSISVLIIFVCFFVFSSAESFAVQSATKATKVGAAPDVGKDTLVQAAQVIKDGYQTCARGFSFDSYITPKNCLTNFLLENGYGKELIIAFETTRKRGLINSTGKGLCNECLPFVATSLSLISGDNGALSFGNPAAIFNNKLNPSGEFGFSVSGHLGTYIYKRQGHRAEIGDVGIGEAGNGHILVVKEVKGNIKFVALESNWGRDCSVRDTVEHEALDYTFYRLDSLTKK